MTDPNRELVDDFIHSKGCFSEESIENYVDPQELRAARYHQSAGCRFLELAKEEETRTESERLKQKAKQHFHQVELILRKYNC